MTINYTNVFHSKDLQHLPKLVFLVLKYTIWQPWKLLGDVDCTGGQTNKILKRKNTKSTEIYGLAVHGRRGEK
jgi:hypothetical protein